MREKGLTGSHFALKDKGKKSGRFSIESFQAKNKAFVSLETDVPALDEGVFFF